MRRAKIIIIAAMGMILLCVSSKISGQNADTKPVAPISTPDSSSGTVVLFFPDWPNGLEWNHPDGMQPMSNVPLYNPGESKPFDTLQFELKLYKYEDLGEKYETTLYSAHSSAGTHLAPFRFCQGDFAAEKWHSNIRYENTDNMWVKTHKSFVPIYDVAFRLMGQWGEWLYIMLDDSTKRCAYIRSDSLRMQLIPWEYYMGKRMLNTPEGCDMYDEPNGKLIKSNSTGGYIESLRGDWVKIYNSGWIKWKDEYGILSGFYSFNPIR